MDTLITGLGWLAFGAGILLFILLGVGFLEAWWYRTGWSRDELERENHRLEERIASLRAHVEELEGDE